MIHAHRGINMHYELGLDGGGREVCPEFLRVVREKVGRVKRAYEFCAGTGFIGFTLLAEGLCEELVLSDIQEESLQCCRRTVQENGLDKKVLVYNSDCLEQLPLQSFDLVVANPPHFSERQTNLPQSPIINVDAGWEIHRRFYQGIGKYLNPNGSIIFVENGRGSSPEIFSGMIEAGGLRFQGAIPCNLARPSKFYFMLVKKA